MRKIIWKIGRTAAGTATIGPKASDAIATAVPLFFPVLKKTIPMCSSYDALNPKNETRKKNTPEVVK